MNVDVDLRPFENIIPCGIEDRDVSSVAKHMAETGRSIPGKKDVLMDAYSQALVQAFEANFSVSFNCVRRSLDLSRCWV